MKFSPNEYWHINNYGIDSAIRYYQQELKDQTKAIMENPMIKQEKKKIEKISMIASLTFNTEKRIEQLKTMTREKYLEEYHAKRKVEDESCGLLFN